jgi:hypothetical protein
LGFWVWKYAIWQLCYQLPCTKACLHEKLIFVAQQRKISNSCRTTTENFELLSHDNGKFRTLVARQRKISNFVARQKNCDNKNKEFKKKFKQAIVNCLLVVCRIRFHDHSSHFHMNCCSSVHRNKTGEARMVHPTSFACIHSYYILTYLPTYEQR